MNASVGPLTECPATSGLTAITGPLLARTASRRPGSASSGPIEITGFDGPITTASAAAIASSVSAVGVAFCDPLELDRLDRALTLVDDQELLQAATALRRGDEGPHRLLAHRQHPRCYAERPPDLRLRCGQRAALGHELSPVDRGGEVEVGEAEPPRRAELDESFVDREAVVLEAPAALLVDRVGEPVRDEVGVDADVEAVHRRRRRPC